MSGLEYDYDDVLRRALHSAAESIEPSPDGLERIRERLTPPSLFSFAVVSDWYTETTQSFVRWAEPVIDSMLDIFWATVDRFRPEEPSGHARSRYGWLRPAAAMGTAIFVIAAGILAVMTLPQAISSSSSISLPWTQHAATGSSAQAAAHSASHLARGGHSVGPSGTAAGSPAASSRCSSPGTTPSGSSSPSPSTSGSSTPPATASTSPSITPTDSATPTTDPSPSVTDSSTSDPGSEGTPTPSASSAATSITAGLSATLNVVKPAARASLAAVLDAPGATHTPSRSKSPSPKKSTTCAPPR